ncbi:5-hydroxytryptamine receptor 1D [Elysia marginata]|uniref:5-hydroxytryptamine receptor 1D n=1 Tax=Elysia marginata TaxID=1093978 RepID=A0AAV4FRN6_9GAST|nr:5-hydroxytryptamine receptor 1D [Elysia marginata]
MTLLGNNSDTSNSLEEVILTKGYTSAGDAVVCAVGLLLAACILIVNIITITTLYRTPSLYTLSNTIMASLAVSDLLVGLVLIPFSLYSVHSFRSGVFDNYMRLCHLLVGGCFGWAAISSLHMSLIAVERYIYIVWPFFYLRMVTRLSVASGITATWIIGMVYIIMPQFVGPMDAKRCSVRIEPVGYTMYSVCSMYVVLASLNIVLYSRILKTARNQRRAFHIPRGSFVTDTSSTCTCVESFDHQTYLEQEKESKFELSKHFYSASNISSQSNVRSHMNYTKPFNILQFTKKLMTNTANADLCVNFFTTQKSCGETLNGTRCEISRVERNSLEEQSTRPHSVCKTKLNYPIVIANGAKCMGWENAMFAFGADFQLYTKSNITSKTPLQTIVKPVLLEADTTRTTEKILSQRSSFKNIQSRKQHPCCKFKKQMYSYSAKYFRNENIIGSPEKRITATEHVNFSNDFAHVDKRPFPTLTTSAPDISKSLSTCTNFYHSRTVATQIAFTIPKTTTTTISMTSTSTPTSTTETGVVQEVNTSVKPRTHRSLTFVMALFFSHFVCITPAILYFAIIIEFGIPSNALLGNSFSLLALSNSGMNFVVFLLLQASFRKAVVRQMFYLRNSFILYCLNR